MHGDSDQIISSEDWTRAVNKAIRVLSRKWARAHYNLDIESITWYAAGVLWTHPEEQWTLRFLIHIANTMLIREVEVKVRNTIVIDTSNMQVEQEESAYDICKSLSTKTLTDEERQILSWYLDDGLRLVDIAELMGLARSSITRKWQKIITKLKEENL